jgi:site-specific recombinase XerD
VKLRDISLSGEYPGILIHGKGKKERRIYLTEKTVGHLEQYLQVYHADSSLDADLFSTTIKGVTSAMSHSNVRRILKDYSEMARSGCNEIPKSVYPHMLRRTRATNLYQDGVPIELVSTILGHAQIETTKTHYAKPSLAQIRESMESVPTPAADEEPLWVGSEDEIARRCGLR